MQEVLAFVEQMFANAKTEEVESAMNDVINIITQIGIEKEKEQIIDAYEDGYESCDLDEVMEVNKKLTSGKLYYNMNYNQNK